MEAFFEGLEATGMFGMAGTIGTMGTLGRPEALIFGVVFWGGTAEDGVVGCVERASEGG